MNNTEQEHNIVLTIFATTVRSAVKLGISTSLLRDIIKDIDEPWVQEYLPVEHGNIALKGDSNDE